MYRRNKGNYKDGRTLKDNYCIDCGIEISDYRAKRCQSCAGKFNTYLPDNNPNWIGGKPKCRDCGIQLNNYIAKRCWKCYVIWSKNPKNNPMYGVHRFGKNAPCWCGGISKEGYSYKFNNYLKESIRKRDNYICQKCNKKEKNNLRGNNYTNLDVHHIDYNKNNCNTDNLITLCIGCNTKANYNRDYWYAYFRYLMEN
jgi:hypothetical protein